MPELPDVEQFKRYFDATALHKTIQKAGVGDPRILDGVSARRLQAALRGNAFESTHRHGKRLFVYMRAGPVLRLHFGMTGGLEYFKDSAKEPSHDRLRVDFTDGYHLAFVCQRLLGHVGLTDDVAAFIEEKRLGPDALRMDLEAFKHVLAGRRGSIKSALMNQQVVAGLGNIYSDEVLFQAGLHPESAVDRLDGARLAKLFDVMKFILRTAISRRADARHLPADFLVHYRHEGGACPRCNGDVKPVRIAGRRAWYCGRCQERVA